MPVLPSEFLSTWYRLRNKAGVSWLVQSWTEKQLQNAENHPLIQGDIGVRTMDIGGTYFEHTIQTPVLVVETPVVPPDTGVNDKINSAIFLLADAFNKTRTPIYTTTQLDYVLKSGAIRVSEDGVMVDMTLNSDIPSALAPVYLPSINDYIARVAKWYDCDVYIQDPSLTSVYQVKSANITFVVKLEMMYFIGTNQSPYFVVQGYEVNADLEILISPEQYEALLQSSGGMMKTQKAGDLRAHKAISAYKDRQISISVGNKDNKTTIYFGKALVMSEIERGMQPSKVTTLKLNFKGFVNSSTPITVTQGRSHSFTV